jgi:hypothetical protein
MKKLFFASLMLVAFQMNAAILVVKEYGVNATYSTIVAALTAAANNDTIVVYDKPSGQQWTEDLTIDKNLTFMHPTQGTRFKAPGNITIVPKAGMDLYMIGWNLDSKSITATSTDATATSSNRAKITIGDCQNVSNINLNVDWIDARLFYNQTNITGNFTFRHGMAIANVLSGGIEVMQESTTASQNDSILVVGNKANWCYIDTKEAGVVANNYFNNNVKNAALTLVNHNAAANAIFSIVNNTLINSITAVATAGYIGNCGYNCQTIQVTTAVPHGFFNGQSVTLSGWSNGYFNGTFGISNVTANTFTFNRDCGVGGNCNGTNGSGSGGSVDGPVILQFSGLRLQNSGIGNVRILNNLIYNASASGASYGVYNTSTSGQPLISHNYINLSGGSAGQASSVGFNNELNYTSNSANAYGSIDTWGRASSGNTNLINKGNYLGEYYDIDLTRNDIGTYGGPYSIDNYLTSGTGKGKVLYVNIKHQLTNLNQILNVKGSAGAKF